jgi:hypothetical protein
MEVYIANAAGDYWSTTVRDLLPSSFGGDDLNEANDGRE